MLNRSGGGCVSDTSSDTSSAAVSVASSTIAILAASSRVASSIPSVVVSSTAISRQHQHQIPVAVVAAGNCVLGTSGTTANSVFGKKKLVNIMSSPIHPSVHTYSRPRILGKGREVGGTPGKILQQQTPPTNAATTNNTGIGIVVAVGSSSSNSSVTTNTEFGTFSSCSGNINHNNIQNSQNTMNNVSASLLQSVNSNNTGSHILANNISNSATFFNILPSTSSSGGVGSVGSNATPANVNHPGSILIGNTPPCNSPPASKLVVRLPSLSPANTGSTSTETVVPMQIENIQVVDEVEMENEMVQSVVEVEIDYQTLVALNDMQPAAEQTFGDGVQLEIDGTTAVLDLGNNCPKQEEQHTFVISQDADTQVINLMEIKSGEEIDNIRQINLEENEDVMPGELAEVKILQNGEDVPPEHYEVVTSQQILDLNDAGVVTQEVDVVCEKEEDLNADDNVISNHSVVASQNIQFTFEPMQDGGYMEVELNTENQIGSSTMEIDSDENKPGETQALYNCEIQVAKDELSFDEKIEVSKNTENVLECKSDDSGNIKDNDVESMDEDEKNAENVSFDNIVILVSEKSPEESPEESPEDTKCDEADINNENVECELEVQGVVNADDTTSITQPLETDEATTESADDATADESETISFNLDEKSNIVNSLNVETEKKHIIINIESGATAGEELVCMNVKPDSDVEESVGILKTENEELGIDEVETQTIVETICEIATQSIDNMQDNPQSDAEIDMCVEKCSEIETAAKNQDVVVVGSETPFTELSQDATTNAENVTKEEPSSLDKEEDEEIEAEDSPMGLIIDIDNGDKDKEISPSVSSDQLMNGGEDGSRGKVDTNNASEIISKKQSSEATLIPIIPIADEAYNGHETEKIVAATVPINEYEAQVVEPADPEPANIRVVEQPPVIPCVQLLDEPPDEIEVVGKAALQWRNGVGILPGSNLKFKMNELGVMELIVQEDENENEIDAEIDVNSQANGHEEYDENNVDEEEYMEVEHGRSNGGLERREFESTDQDSISDRSGSRSPEYHSKPPPRAKFSIMSNMKTSNSSATSPFTSTEAPAAEDEIESCTSCGRFGLISELTNLVCTPCITLAKKKEKFARKSTPSSQSETTSEDNFKIPPQKTFVPQKSIYPIIPRNAMSLKLKQRTETITTTMTNSAAIVLGIKDKAVMDSLNAGIGLACSKIIQESKAKNGIKNNSRKSKNAVSSEVVLRDRRRNSAQTLSKAMPQLDCSEKNFIEDNDIDNTNKDMPQLNMDEMEFEWPKYLAETKSKSAPQRLFRQPALPPKNPFLCGMILEAIDPQHQSLFCLVVVVETQGYRIKLRFIGFAEVYDFWMNADSLEIFPCGWCEANNYKLETPPELTLPQDWQRFALLNGYDVAPRENFSILNEEPLSDSGVEVGMRLEAVDIRNQNLVCVATVANVMGDRFLVHFDSWDTLYDYWTDVTSPFIHPVGWCEENHVKLTPPNNFKSNFTWDGYLKFTKCSAMPSKLFQPLPPVGFKKGMKIECVDKRNPVLVRVATVATVEAHELLIHFDNFSDIYDYKVYELSPDIHPVGWCSHTGHTLQAPPQLDRQWSGPCKTFGCLAFGNIKGPQFATHNTEKNCPYAPYNYKKESSLPDRIIVYEKNFGPCEKDDLDDESEEEPPKLNRRALKPRSTIVAPKRTTGGKRKRDSVAAKVDPVDAEPMPLPDALLSQTEPGPSSSSTTRANNSNQNIVSVNNAQSFSTSKGASIVFVYPTPVPSTKPPSLSGQPVQSQVPYTRDFVEEPPEKRRRISHASSGSSPALGASTSVEEEEAFHSQDQNYHDISLKLLVSTKDANEVSKWKTKEVVDFASRIPGCKEAANLFAEHMIDGESFLMLSQSDLTSVMHFKIGPAIKLANAIRLINSNRSAPSK